MIKKFISGTLFIPSCQKCARVPEDQADINSAAHRGPVRLRTLSLILLLSLPHMYTESERCRKYDLEKIDTHKNQGKNHKDTAKV